MEENNSQNLKMQRLVKEIVEKYNLETSIESRYIDLVSEVGEVGKEILKSNDYGKKEFLKTDNMELEIGDALFSLICISNSLNIDIDKALNDSIKKYEKRFEEKGNISS